MYEGRPCALCGQLIELREDLARDMAGWVHRKCHDDQTAIDRQPDPTTSR
jgi:hypothetical protein